jgi:hypothetical protein
MAAWAAVVAAAAECAGGSPAAAMPQEQWELTDVFIIQVDADNNLAAFINQTRQTYCTADVVAFERALLDWINGGFVGAPPPYPGKDGLETLTATAQQVGQGPVRLSFDAEVPVELWTFEEGKSPALENLVAPCIDTDGVDDLTGDPLEPGAFVAGGSGSWSAHDNDAFGTGTRTNVWSDRIHADLSGPGGDYRYQGRLWNQDRRGEYRGTAQFLLQGR